MHLAEPGSVPPGEQQSSSVRPVPTTFGREQNVLAETPRRHETSFASRWSSVSDTPAKSRVVVARTVDKPR